MTGPEPEGRVPLRRVAAGLVRQVAALASFVAALMFYAGVMYESGYYGHFHLDVFALDFGFPEFIVASLHLIRLPAVAIAVLVLLAPRLPGFVERHPEPEEARWLRRRVHFGYGWAARGWRSLARGYAGVVLLGVLFLLIWNELGGYAWVAPLTIAAGLLLGQTGSAQPVPAARSAGPAPADPRARAAALSYTSLAVLGVGLLLVWVVALTAGRLGAHDAVVTERHLDRETAVVIYSRDLLGFPLNSPEDLGRLSAFRYRYTGFRLILQRGDRYYLVPLGWRHDRDPVSILQQSDTLRVDLLPG